METTGFQQAQLEIEGGDTITCLFNPTEYTVAKSNTWNVKEVKGSSLPTAQFGGGQPRKLNLDLLLDASDKSDGDVRTTTDLLFAMMEVDKSLGSGKGKNSGRPPMVTFRWGPVVSFKAVIDSLSVQYTLFQSDGRPIRAQVKLSLIQAARAVDASSKSGGPKQNPTTRGEIFATHVVRDGDSLPSISHEAYGDPTLWRAIAETNGIDDPLRLQRGTSLSIPARPT